MRHLAFKHVHRLTTRHGKTVYYLRVRGSASIRLPDIDDPSFQEAYAAALAQRPVVYLHHGSDRRQPLRQMCEKAMKEALPGARARAAARGLSFSLTLDWALATIERNDFRCELTGIPFFSPHGSTGKKNPFAPSLDRIIPKLGYTEDNVRIVVFALNLMMLDWGPVVVEQVAVAYRNKKRRQFRDAIPSPDSGMNKFAATR